MLQSDFQVEPFWLSSKQDISQDVFNWSRKAEAKVEVRKNTPFVVVLSIDFSFDDFWGRISPVSNAFPSLHGISMHDQKWERHQRLLWKYSSLGQNLARIHLVCLFLWMYLYSSLWRVHFGSIWWKSGHFGRHRNRICWLHIDPTICKTKSMDGFGYPIHTRNGFRHRYTKRLSHLQCVDKSGRTSNSFGICI